MLHISFSTPEQSLYSGTAMRATLSTSSGEITILSGHEPLLTTINSGSVIIENKDDKKIFTAFSGIVNINNINGDTHVKILLESSEDVKYLDGQSLEASIKRAREANAEDIDTTGLQLGEELLKDLNRLKLSRRYSR